MISCLGDVWDLSVESGFYGASVSTYKGMAAKSSRLVDSTYKARKYELLGC